jgi:prevent-host-death family protein
MMTVKENTTIVGVSELRSKLEQVLKASKYSKIIINQRNKPVAVLMDIDVYNRLDELIEEWSDQQLAHEAKQRASKSKKSDYISSAEARKRLGL